MVNVVDSAPAVPKVRSARAGRRDTGSWIRRVPLVPALVFMFIVTQLPFVLTLWYSFQRYNLNFPTAPRDFPTFWNYDQIFSDHIFRVAVLNTVLLTAVPVIASVVLSGGSNSERPRSQPCWIAVIVLLASSGERSATIPGAGAASPFAAGGPCSVFSRSCGARLAWRTRRGSESASAKSVSP